MQQRRKDLQQFDTNCLNEIRRLRKGDKCYFSAGANSSFLDELEVFLKILKTYVMYGRESRTMMLFLEKSGIRM